MSKITDFAEGKDCTARIPGLCKNDTATTVWAHIRSIRWGSGTGEKPPDIIGLIACQACHDEIDRRTRHVEKDWVKLLAYEGHCESLYLLHKAGVI